MSITSLRHSLYLLSDLASDLRLSVHIRGLVSLALDPRRLHGIPGSDLFPLIIIVNSVTSSASFSISCQDVGPVWGSN